MAVSGLPHDPRNLSGIVRKLEENSGSRVDYLPVSLKSCFVAPTRDPSEKSTFMAGLRKRHPERLVCQKFKMFLQKFPFVPER